MPRDENAPLILGLDTSCYTTSAALVRNSELVGFQRKLLPVPKGERGLRQSEAVFAHIKQLPEVIGALPDMAGRLAAVAVSASPRDGENSYMPVFQAGVTVARAMARAAGVPVIETTHQRGHIRAARYHSGLPEGDFLAVHLSGGTTEVLLMRGDDLTPVGRGRDLHFGQLVDRTGVMLGLAFPCGPALEVLARRAGGAGALLPAAMEGCDCHLSGAEAALARLHRQGLAPERIAIEVYSVLERTCFRMLEAAAEKTGVFNVLLAGGVASSALFREMLLSRAGRRRSALRLFFGEPRLSSDNAAGVALLGEDKLRGMIR